MTDSKIYIYIIQGTYDYYYCGITHDIYSRYKAHNSGHSKSTRYNKPYILKWLREVNSRTKARFIEVMIKKHGVKRFVTKQKYRAEIEVSKRLIEDFYSVNRWR